MNRRRFLGISAASVGGLLVTGAAYKFFRPSDPLDSFRRSTKRVLTSRFGKPRADEMLKDVQADYMNIASSVPYIGGTQIAPQDGRGGIPKPTIPGGLGMHVCHGRRS